jgi:hypothetical protein
VRLVGEAKDQRATSWSHTSLKEEKLPVMASTVEWYVGCCPQEPQQRTGDAAPKYKPHPKGTLSPPLTPRFAVPFWLVTLSTGALARVANTPIVFKRKMKGL